LGHKLDANIRFAGLIEVQKTRLAVFAEAHEALIFYYPA
jgi:hypothetical protein